jgi:cyclophilin family peptidyl-prolyl cis-trans isomerase
MLIRRLFVLLAAFASLPGLAAAAEKPRLADERVLLRTNRGDLVLALYPDVAPKHVAQILKLVRLGVYDSTFINRVEPGYVVQLTNAQNRKRALSPEQLAAITKLPAETSPTPHQVGSLSMAREPADRNSAETSFSILLRPAPHLDGQYTVFGEVAWGMPLVNMVAAEPLGDRGAPLDPPVVEQALVLTTQQLATQQLRDAIPSTRRPGRPRVFTPLHTAALTLILACNLALVFLGGRWQPRTRLTFNAAAAVVGVALLIAYFVG